MIAELLEKAGLKYEDLNAVEKETLNTWMDALQQGQASVEKIKEYVVSMKEGVEVELSKCDLGSKQDIFLKARLRNYSLLVGFLTSPERAKQQMESAIRGMIKR